MNLTEEIIGTIETLQRITGMKICIEGSKKALRQLPMCADMDCSVNDYPVVWNGYKCIVLDTECLDDRIYLTTEPKRIMNFRVKNEDVI